MNAFLLNILGLFKWLFRLMGADYQQVRAIVAIKLMMDNRRQIISYRKKENQEPASTFVWTIFLYAVFGGVVAIGLYNISSFILSMTMFFSYIMVMIAMTLITDFSSVLLDTSDNTIILPRPVSSRTLFIARISHILLYLGQITVGLTIFPALVVLLKYGVTLFILFLAATLLAVLTAVLITNALYLLILQFASEEKLKNVINYFQIIMAIFIMAGYQLGPRMAGALDLDDYVFELRWWNFFTPPVWMAGALEGYYLRIFDGAHLLLTALALIIPVLGFYLVNRYLTPVFTRKLGIMAVETQATTTRQARPGLASRLSAWVTRNPIERAAFELIYHITGRDRKIKLKIYPSFGYIFVFGLIFMFRDRADLISTWNNLPYTHHYLMLIYLTFMILQVALYEIPYSDDFKASWIYFSSPLKTPADILSGTIKALFIRLFLPGYIVISIIILMIWGLPAADDIAFGLCNNILMFLIIVLINKRSLPLSMAHNTRNQTGSFVRGIVVLLLVGLLGLAHYILGKYRLLLMLAIPAQVMLIYVLYGVYRKTSWRQITL
jgi:ABC-2 type transport system permease protein